MSRAQQAGWRRPAPAQGQGQNRLFACDPAPNGYRRCLSYWREEQVSDGAAPACFEHMLRDELCRLSRSQREMVELHEAARGCPAITLVSW
jgi:hypothetical protein